MSKVHSQKAQTSNWPQEFSWESNGKSGENTIFVFGSNLAGRHGKGAALEAKDHWGAIYGKGIGLQGRSYAIPTKDHKLQPLPLNVIKLYIKGFLLFAEERNDLTFLVTPIGCGLAGYSDSQVAPLFTGAPDNCKFTERWQYYGINN